MFTCSASRLPLFVFLGGDKGTLRVKEVLCELMRDLLLLWFFLWFFLQRAYEAIGHQFVDKKRWRLTMWSALRRLENDFHSSFSCEVCGSFATCPIIICDGTAVAFRQALARPVRTVAQSQSANLRRGSLFRDRVLIPVPKLRKCLRELSKQIPRVCPNSFSTSLDQVRNIVVSLRTRRSSRFVCA